MTDHLTRLAARSLGIPGLLEPRPASVFEPVQNADGPTLSDGLADETDLEKPSEQGRRLETDAGDRKGSRQDTSSFAPARRSSAADVRSVALPPRGSAADAAVTERPAVSPSHDAPAPVGRRADDVPIPLPGRSGAEHRAIERGPAVTAATPGRPVLEGRPWSRREGEDAGVLHPALQPEREGFVDVTRQPPIIRVTIGRVEVRAVVPSTPARERTPRPPTSLSLDDYLRQRNGHRR